MKISITGKMRVGKTTVARYLETKYGFHVKGFADPIKDFAKELGWDGGKDEKGRALLQNIGTIARDYNERFWIDKLVSDIEGIEKIVIDDMRMVLEHEELEKIGFKTIMVCKSEKLIEGAPESKKKHITEKEVELIKPWKKIKNNGSFDDLYKQVDEAVSELNEMKLYQI